MKRIGLLSLLLIGFSLSAMEYQHENNNNCAGNDKLSLVSWDQYETFKQMWRVYKIVWNAIKEAHQENNPGSKYRKHKSVEKCYRSGQQNWPGFLNTVNQTNGDLCLCVTLCAVPESMDLITPWGMFAIFGSGHTHVTNQKETFNKIL